MFALGGCASISATTNIPKENSSRKDANLIKGELIDGRYYCLPGCIGHTEDISICSTKDLQQELFRRSVQFSTEDMSMGNE